MENSQQYEKLTAEADWAGICKLNGAQLDAFGTKKELGVLSKYLESGEVVYALTSGIMKQSDTSNEFDFGSNTWLIVLTNERFLLLDHAMFTSSVDTQSIRLNRVQAVSSSQGWVLGKVMVDLGSRMVTIDNCQKATVAPIADLANKLLREREGTQGQRPPQSSSDNDLISQLEKLASMRSAGVLSDDEFASAKAKLLS